MKKDRKQRERKRKWGQEWIKKKRDRQIKPVVRRCKKGKKSGMS